eukprot:6735760-Pyramimonas_sp.AAC.1
MHHALLDALRRCCLSADTLKTVAGIYRRRHFASQDRAGSPSLRKRQQELPEAVLIRLTCLSERDVSASTRAWAASAPTSGNQHIWHAVT